MTRHVAALVTAIGISRRTRLAPGGRRFGTLEETAALSDAVGEGRRQPRGHLLRLARERREAREAATRETA